MQLHYGDMTDSSSLVKIISSIHPTEIYNLAAQSHVKVRLMKQINEIRYLSMFIEVSHRPFPFSELSYLSI